MNRKQQDLKYYVVDGHAGWFVVKARSKSVAKSEGIKEWGRGHVKNVSIAKDSDVILYRAIKGEIETIE